jgi:REP element-mobilizing transposase RayT
MSTIVPMIPGGYYHVYNRGNNRENIFRDPRSYSHFLRLYAKYIKPMADTYAYCLMRNHFHILIQIKEDLTGVNNLSGLLKYKSSARGANPPGYLISPRSAGTRFPLKVTHQSP